MLNDRYQDMQTHSTTRTCSKRRGVRDAVGVAPVRLSMAYWRRTWISMLPWVPGQPFGTLWGGGAGGASPEEAELAKDLSWERMATPLQLGFTDYEQTYAKTKTRRQIVLEEMDVTVPWNSFLALI